MMTPLVKVNRINKFFNKRKSNELHVLKNIDITLPNKGLVMLLGPSGSGKTTLLNVMGGLDKFDKGELQVTDKTFTSYQSRKWDDVRNYHIGYIFQNYHLMRSLSVYDNVAYPLRLMGFKDETLIEEKVHYVLKAVNMFQYRKKNAMQLSGGQMQRVAIARAVVKNPEIIIADEPTGNLDSQNTVEVMTMLKHIAQDKLVIMVTHEKELATYYGDRILEIKDGQISADHEDHDRGDYAFKYDETIYLKDLKKSSYQKDHHQIDVYEDEEHAMPLDVMLVLKNDTLYIKTSSDTKKVKFIDEHTTIKIKDDHAKAAQEKIIKQTSFDSERLTLPNIEKKHSFMFSLKQASLMALDKIINTTRRGKIMLFSFLLAGAVVAYAASSIAAIVFVSPEPYMQVQEGYHEVSIYGDNTIDANALYDDIIQISGEEGYINTLPSATMNFVSPSGSLYQTSIQAQLDIMDYMDFNVMRGETPSSDHQIMISSIMANTLIDTRTGQDIGIWSYDHLLAETLRFNELDLTISGIVESDIPVIFVTKTMSNIVSPVGDMYSHALIDEDDITRGTLPNLDEILIPESYGITLGFDIESVTYPYELQIGMQTITVSGTHNDSSKRIYTSDEHLERLRFQQNVNAFYVYAKEDIETQLIEVLPEDSFVINVYQNALENVQNEQQLFFLSTYTTAGVVVGIAALGFFFVIRSSLTKRQYDIAIMRAIGVYKRDIFRAFTVEIIILTTISTLIGYSLATYAFSLLSQSLLGELNFFKVTFLSFVGGMIASYLINLLAGLLPVWRMLKKTPAQILSDYDM